MKNTLTVLFLLGLTSFLQSNAQTSMQRNENTMPVLGLTASVESDSLANAAGFVYLEETVKRMLAPSVSEETFTAHLQKLKRARCRIQTCNLFIPGYLKLMGPEVNEAWVLGYVDTVMQRAEKAGIGLIVLGSGEARKIPEGVNREDAKQQFIRLARKMAAIAAKHNCLISMENLNATETNFVNTLAEACQVVTAVDHPNFRLTADIYHMLRENEPAANIEKAKGILVHCHIAEREKRSAPGVERQDFRPYLAALRSIGYKGRIMMECKWNNPAVEYAPAVAYLEGQLKEVYHISGKK
ncbi:sugar phosphate isomerase/epimerase family protein [Chitinophaga varians]|uniref:sugar phosphate isomerase/epimerase family protein n=1 Tax=Chitinophaga varians TaxID=2202339 RepID=UPI00165FFD79|nr:sugar phosphate isomerase/epimerase family protein [Chitinophaga varians]MBC9909594.1 sugar phosphate isomerase/epimerase [Chitinophaga varians]